jgi:hypothetical protein
MKTSFSFLLLIALLCELLFASTAKADLPVAGASLWFNADAITGVSNGAGVAVWEDLGSQGVDVEQTFDPAKQPTYVTNELNGRPVVRFDGLGQNLKSVNNVSITQPNQVYVVFRIDIPEADADINRRVLDVETAAAGSTDNASRQTMSVRQDPTVTTNGWQYHAGSGASSASKPTDWGINEIVVNGSSSHWDRNGQEFTSGNFGTRNLNGRLAIGSRHTEIQDFFDGDIAEIIHFDNPLNSAEVTILNSHLSAKYAIPVTGAKYTGYGTRDRDVFGIGRVDGANELASGNLAGLTLSSSSLTSDSWLMAGHNSTANGMTSTGEASHWTRTWYVDNTNVGSTSTVDFSFDFSDGGVTFNPSATYKLLYSATDPLSFSIASGSANVAGDKVSFSIAGNLLADGYYTIGELEGAPNTPGDFDGDGDVDGRDFLVWQRSPSIGSLSDWQNNYGAGALSARVTSVPEPTNILVLSPLVCLLAVRSRRTR